MVPKEWLLKRILFGLAKSIISFIPFDDLWLAVRSLPKESKIRFSFAGLIRIYVDGKYLLIRGNRVRKFQPVGGVLKFCKSATFELHQIGMTEDTGIPVDRLSTGDLRIRIPNTRVFRLMRWFRSRRGRETDPKREFKEELIDTKLLPSDIFSGVDLEYCGVIVTGPKKSIHFNCDEILVHEIFDLNLSAEQLAYFRRTQAGEIELPADIIWSTHDAIASEGYNGRNPEAPAITNHARNILIGAPTR